MTVRSNATGTYLGEMTLRISAVLTLVTALLALLSPQALAQACQGRPGASAIEQYCEAIPEGTGERVTPSSERESRGSASNVPAGTAQELADAGQEGQAVLGLAASSSGGGDSSDGGGNGGSSSSSGSGSGSSGSAGAENAASATPAASSPSDNPLKAVSSAVSNGATVGSGFLWGLLALALAAAGAAWIGFRRHDPPSSES